MDNQPWEESNRFFSPFHTLSGWWLSYPSEKYESQLVTFPTEWENTCSKPPTSYCWHWVLNMHQCTNRSCSLQRKITALKLSAGEMTTTSSKKKHGKHLQPFSESNWDWLRLATFYRNPQAMTLEKIEILRYPPKAQNSALYWFIMFHIKYFWIAHTFQVSPHVSISRASPPGSH